MVIALIHAWLFGFYETLDEKKRSACVVDELVTFRKGSKVKIKRRAVVRLPE